MSRGEPRHHRAVVGARLRRMLRTAIRYLITGALALVVMVAPVLIVFLLFQRWFVRSIADSAIQG